MKLKNICKFFVNNKRNNHSLFSTKKKDLYCILFFTYLETLGINKNSTQN